MPTSTGALPFQGPFTISVEQTEFDDFPAQPGLYLWCVDCDDGITRVHYVGEAKSIRSRIIQHKKQQLLGDYHAFSIQDLRKNTKVLVHRSRVGVVQRFDGRISADQANQEYLEGLSIFHAVLPEMKNDKQRRQFETAIAHKVEDSGPNMLEVGRINQRVGNSKIYRVTTNSSRIEALTNQDIEVGIIEA